MANKRKFTCVEVDYGEDETKNFGQRTEFSDPTSLYEVHTIATIAEEENNENIIPDNDEIITTKEGKIPVIKCCNNDEIIAVVVDSYISFFSIQYDIRHLFTLNVTGVEDIVALCFLPDTDIIAAVSCDAKLLFVSVKYRSVICRLILSENKLHENPSITSSSCFGDYYISIASGKTCYTARLFNFQEILAVYHEPKEAQEILERIKKTPIEFVECDTLISDVIAMPVMSANFLAPYKANTNIVLTEIGGLKSLYCHFPVEVLSGIVRARICAESGLLLLLANDGRFLTYDTRTCALLFEKKILPDNERPLDFLITDYGELTSSTKIALLVECKTETQLQIRSFGDGKIWYSIVISSDSMLLNVALKEDGTVFFVEFVYSQKSDGDLIRLRSLSECQPDMRLQRMLNRCQFDQAEELATLFKLDLQKVHIARASYLLSCLDSQEEDKKIVDAFIDCLDKITDHNWVGESCSAGATLCRSFGLIVSILRYAERRNITDPETLEILNRLRYNLATYRMLFGPEKASFERDSAWSDFVSDDSWEELFLNFCKQGCATEARLLWNRYNNVLKPWMQHNFNAFSSFLDALSNYVVDDKSPADLLELAEKELLPVVLNAHPHSLSERFFDWLISFVNKLEVLYPEDFPENALHVCSIMERTAKAMILDAVTPLQQAQLAHALATIHIDSEDEAYPMGRLNVYVKNLREMDKLKKKYDCCLSYDLYKEQTKESICHLILKRARNIQLVNQNIKQFAIPYMEEYKLDVDQTLFNYILEVARLSAGVATDVNPWDARCLAIAETIGCHGLRCKAVIGIAKRAYPPWTHQLCTAVNFVLNDANIDSALKIELHRQCDLAQLGQLLMPYTVPFSHLEEFTSGSRYVTSLIGFLLRQEQVEPDLEKRILDSLKVIQLMEKLKPGLVNREVCYLQCCTYIISALEDKDMFSTLNRCISALNESDRKLLVKRIVASVVTETDTDGGKLTLAEQRLRIAKIDAALCVLERHFSEQDDCLELSMKLRGVKKLQERFGIFVGCKMLESGKKEQLLKNFILSEDNLRNSSRVLEFAHLLTICYERACIIAANCALDSKEILLALHFAKFGLRGSVEVNTELLEVSMRCCILGLWNLHGLAVNGCLDQLFILVEALAGFAPPLVEAAISSLSVHPLALQFSTYMDLYLRVIEQCKMDESEKGGVLECTDSQTGQQDIKSDIYGMNRRLGIYHHQSDGAIFDKADAVCAVALVACSVVEQNSGMDKELVQFYEEMRANWESLFVFFSVNNQPFLELRSRSFSLSLPCFREQIMQQYNYMKNSLRTLSERVLLQYPSDLCLISCALFAVPPDLAKQILLELRKWAKSRKTPQLMLNLIRLSRFICILYGDCSTAEQMTHYYIICAWTRRMLKLGAIMPNDLGTEAVVQEFVRSRIEVNELLDFCADFSLDKCEAVLQYALRMAKMSSVEKDVKVADEMFKLSSNAFQLLTVTEDIFFRLYDCLTLLCPYNYTVIELLISEMKKRVKEDEECQVTLAQRLITLYSFLTTTERINVATESEVRWYQERQKCIEQKEVIATTLFSSVESESATLNCTTAGSGDTGPSGIYEKSNLLLTTLPSCSRFRLPLHVFLFEDEKDIKNILLPIINSELTLFNVNSWQRLARSLPHLSLSRSRLLSGAVMIVIKGHIQNGTTLKESEIELIESLLFNAPNQMAIVDALSQGFKSIPLCETKLCLLEIGIQISRKWLQSPDLQHPLNDKTRSYVEYWLKKLIPALRLFKTEYLLQREGLLKEETLDIVTSVEQLIVYIYSKEIDWTDSRDKGEKLALINKIAEIYDLDLIGIQAKLLEEWLPAGGSQIANFDLNETDGAVIMTNQDENDIIPTLPYLDSSLTRVLHLLNLRDRRNAALTLAAELSKDWSLSSYSTKVRSLCCLLRLCSPNELENYVQQDATSLCSSMERLLYGRLIEISSIELPLKTFLDKNKSALVRSLLSNNYRQTNQLAYLVSCMVLDYQIVDRSVAEVLLARLHASGRREMLIELLRFCSAHKDLTNVRNLPHLWARTADCMASGIVADVTTPTAKTLIHKFLHFCLSCPVEGGRAFGSLCTTIDALQLPLAGQLIRVAASATSLCMQKAEADRKGAVLDLHLEWTK